MCFYTNHVFACLIKSQLHILFAVRDFIQFSVFFSFCLLCLPVPPELQKENPRLERGSSYERLIGLEDIFAVGKFIDKSYFICITLQVCYYLLFMTLFRALTVFLSILPVNDEGDRTLPVLFTILDFVYFAVCALFRADFFCFH